MIGKTKARESQSPLDRTGVTSERHSMVEEDFIKPSMSAKMSKEVRNDPDIVSKLDELD